MPEMENFNCTDGEAKDDGGEDDEEALSLCDLPLIHQSVNGGDEIEPPLGSSDTPESDFNFCSNEESEMCAADEVFYRGQILPFRRTVSSGKELSSFNFCRSESMDCHSSGWMLASRSSSSSSRSSADAARHRKPPLNLFHSHPSPSPKLQLGGRSNYSKKKSSVWNIFRLGLVTAPPPKIAFEDLKTRTNCRQFGNRNSRKKPSPNFLGGCNCSLDTVIPPKIMVIKRSVSDGNSSGAMRAALLVEEENMLAAAKPSTKKRFSHHRTFEWLKQLSIEGAADER